MNMLFSHYRTILAMHPETVILSPSFGRRISRDASVLNALDRLFGEDPSEGARTLHGRLKDFLEILRPTSALRMTGYPSITGYRGPFALMWI